MQAAITMSELVDAKAGAIETTRIAYRTSELTLTRIRLNGSRPVRIGGAGADDAFTAVIQLRETPDHEFWFDGARHHKPRVGDKAFNIFDHEGAPACVVGAPSENLHLHIPRGALDDLADELDAPRIDRLAAPAGWDTYDPVVEGLKRSLVATTDRPAGASRLFTDQVVLALHTHLASTYGDLRVGARRHVGGLAPRQERAAKEFIAANVAAPLTLVDVAAAAGLSVAHFSRAFKATVGVTPHGWLQSARVARARELLADPELGLAEIALRCGFADQSHFTRVFARATGTTPGRWRRCRLAA